MSAIQGETRLASSARRWAVLTAAVCLLCARLSLAAVSEPAAPPRLATVDWGIAQNLTAMGAPPIAVGQRAGYQTWVGSPPLPPGTRGLGLRAQPNMEMLAQLKPDRILITKMYASEQGSLSRVAPVSVVDVYFTPGGVWHNTVSSVQKLGRITHRPAAASDLIRRTEQNIRRAATRLPDNPPPILLLQLVDAQHVRVYGQRSLIDATMRRMGVTNAWHGKTTRWGMAVVPLRRLADIKHGRVAVMGPVPVGVAEQVASSRVWSSLPVVQNAPVLYLPAVWSFGGLPSASRFAGLLADALEHAPAGGPGWPQDSASSS